MEILAICALFEWATGRKVGRSEYARSFDELRYPINKLRKAMTTYEESYYQFKVGVRSHNLYHCQDSLFSFHSTCLFLNISFVLAFSKHLVFILQPVYSWVILMHQCNFFPELWSCDSTLTC